MSGASNLGYSNINPHVGNSNFVNNNSNNNPAFFGSNETSSFNGLAGSKNNVDAALGKVPGLCLFKGGSRNKIKKIKQKIKNITKIYKMKGSKKRRTIKRKLRNKHSKTKSKYSRRKRIQKGGYSQYMNNTASSSTYSTGGFLSAKDSAMATPVPFNKTNGPGDVVDNYNHYKGNGFSS